jgi:predicted ATPase
MSQPVPAESVIRTPDQRLRVFVSSTLAELADERAAVARAIVSMGLSPVMFELGARPHPPQELYRAYLAQSDVFIGLYWQSYGWVGPGMDISGLEDEFRLAGERPRLLYLKSPAPDREPRLADMIDELRSEGRDAYRSFRSARDLGRLVRDDLAVLLSERFAASAPAGPSSAESPPERTAPRSLPITSTSLIGRDDDIHAVALLLESPESRLVTLTGPGGMGKTRLAIAVGEVMEQEGSTRVVFVPLANVADASGVLPRVAAAVGAVVEGTATALDAIAEHLADADVLLILDNLEQVVDAAPQLDELLARCAGITILATSRTALRLRAEREYAVPSLATSADASADVERIAAMPAVRLFLDRASAVRRDFALTPANARAVAEICRRLDGVPLAIELAAARTRLLDPTALLARLETVLDALGTGPVDLPERQRTLRATVEWSIGLLGSDEAGLLETLSVFADGWTIAASAAVAGMDEFDVLDLIDTLARHSLVNVDASADEPRFRMLTTVRELAAERLRARADHDDVTWRHAEFFASLIDTDTVPADLRTPWADRLRVEEENVRVAITWFFAHDVARIPHLLRSLWLYWQTNDRLVEGRRWVTDLEALVDVDGLDDRARAEVLFTQAVTGVAVGDDDAAVAAVTSIPALVPRIDEPALRNALHLAISWSLPILDDFDGALVAATYAYDGFREHDDAFVAFAALTVGMLRTALDEDDIARGFLREADELGSRFENRWLTSSARTQLAILDIRSGDLDEGRAHIRGCLDEIDDDQVGTITACFMLTAFAELAVAESRPHDAATALGAVDGLRTRAGLLAWPIARRGEAVLRTRVAQLMDAEDLRVAYAAGSELRAPDALALIGRGIS